MTVSQLTAHALLAATSSRHPAQVKTVNGFQEVLAEFQEVLNPSKWLPPVSHGVEHHLQTSGPPIPAKFQLLDPEKLEAARKEFRQLEEDGIVVHYDSPWASPLHMVKKADGSWRPCGDYCQLNLITVPDAYPIPKIMDFSSKAAGCTVFSKLDLRKGYH